MQTKDDSENIFMKKEYLWRVLMKGRYFYN